MKLPDVLEMPKGEDKAVQLAIFGLLTDGGHHKQWYLERVLEALDVNLTKLREDLLRQDYNWKDGVAP